MRCLAQELIEAFNAPVQGGNRFFFEKNKKNWQHDLKKEKGDVI